MPNGQRGRSLLSTIPSGGTRCSGSSDGGDRPPSEVSSTRSSPATGGSCAARGSRGAHCSCTSPSSSLSSRSRSLTALARRAANSESCRPLKFSPVGVLMTDTPLFDAVTASVSSLTDVVFGYPHLLINTVLTAAAVAGELEDCSSVRTVRPSAPKTNSALRAGALVLLPAQEF